MTDPAASFGILDKRFLSRSLGLLNPKSPYTLSEDTPIRQAIEIMIEKKIGCVVITNEQDKLCGIFTERDVLLRLALRGTDVEKEPISTVMTRQPKSAEMTSTIAWALNMMSQGGYRHIPIVDEDDRPVGVVSVKDIVDYIAHTLTKDLLSI